MNDVPYMLLSRGGAAAEIASWVDTMLPTRGNASSDVGFVMTSELDQIGIKMIRGLMLGVKPIGPKEYCGPRPEYPPSRYRVVSEGMDAVVQAVAVLGHFYSGTGCVIDSLDIEFAIPRPLPAGNAFFLSAFRESGNPFEAEVRTYADRGREHLVARVRATLRRARFAPAQLERQLLSCWLTAAMTVQLWASCRKYRQEVALVPGSPPPSTMVKVAAHHALMGNVAFSVTIYYASAQTAKEILAPIFSAVKH